MRDLRIENEWALLKHAAEEMPERLGRPARRDGCFFLTLAAPCFHSRPQAAAPDWQPFQRSEQPLCLRFPRFYPAMPVEVFVEQPVFHPNAHPDTGFVCIWNTHHVANTVLGALARTAAVLRWRMVNEDADNVMQPEALLWRDQLPPEQRGRLPLPAEPLQFAAAAAQLLPEAPPTWRRRLSPC